MIKNLLKGLIQPVTGIIKEVVVDRDQQDQLQAKMKETILNYELSIESELTKRLQLDMASDSWWSKNIRPLSLAFLLVIVTLLAFTDGNIVVGEYTFSIQKDWIDLFRALLLMAFGFYFGSRGIEKVVKTWKA